MNSIGKLAAVAIIGVATAAAAPSPARAGATSGPALVVQWNQLLQQNVAGPPFAQGRVYAMVHIAMADAAVAIEGGYEPWHVHLRASSGASTEAAVAQAAHDVLVALVPSGTAAYDTALGATLQAVPAGRRENGIAVGKAVAAEVLAWRSNDGSASANPQPPLILPSTLPGVWRQTASGPAQYSNYINELPFGVRTATQFMPAPPPQLESPRYAEDFEEVKASGRATGSSRTAEQTRFAQLFASAGPYVNVTNPTRLWNDVAAEVAQAKRLSLLETARVFALLNGVMHDGLQTSHVAKFAYRLWRPETAIAQAADDHNDTTTAEPGWTPLLVTPPYPSHPSNMMCVGASAARVLGDTLGGDAQEFTARWYTGASPPVLVHAQAYSSFHALAETEGNSRVWGGIHFRFELEASEVACTRLAAWIDDHRMKPRR